MTMTDSVLNFLDLHINADSVETFQNGTCRIVSVLRPSWKNLRFQIFNDGCTNKLIAVSDSDFEDVILIRVYGEGTEELIDREAEIRNMKFLHKKGFAPPLFARFCNGLAYGYSPGKVTDTVTCRCPKLFPVVAQTLARIHRLEIEPGAKSGLWDTYHRILRVVPDSFPDQDDVKNRILCDNDLTKNRFMTEINFLQGVIKDLDKQELCGKIVFCHNDLLPGNVIYSKNNNNDDFKTQFIDFEYGEPNYQWYDVANHFAEFVGVKDVLDYDNLYPDETFQKRWIRCYLKAFRETKDDDISEREIHQAYIIVAKFVLCSHLFWTMWSLAQAKISKINYDFLNYAVQRFREYNRKKPVFMNLN